MGVFLLFLPLAITAFGSPEGDFSLAIITFRAFQFVVPKYSYRLGKMEFKESSLPVYKEVMTTHTPQIWKVALSPPKF